MKKFLRVILNPITLILAGFCILLIWLGWNKKAFYGLEFFNFLGPLAGGISLIMGVVFVTTIGVSIILGLVWYGDWYQERFKK